MALIRVWLMPDRIAHMRRGRNAAKAAPDETLTCCGFGK